MKFTVRELTYMALLIALNIILTRIFSVRIPFEGIEGIRIGLGHLPLILAGILIGPTRGFIVGALSDIIGFQLSPSGFYLPAFTMIAGISGFLPAYLLRRFSPGGISFFSLFIAISVTQTVTSLCFTPYLLMTYFGIPFWVTMPGRIVSLMIMTPCFTIIVRMIITRLSQAGMGVAAGLVSPP